MFDAETIREIREGSQVQSFELPDGCRVLAMASAIKGIQHEIFYPIDKPLSGHISQKVALFSTASFIDYVNAFKGDDTQIFADPENNLIRGILNYHKTPVDLLPEDKAKRELEKREHIVITPMPDYADHIATMEIPFSEQWSRWTGIDNQAITQGNFAEFLEENYLDVATPDHATLLEMVTSLQATNNVVFSSGLKLQTGEQQLIYTEAIEGKGKGDMKVPSEIKLNIPIHFDAAAMDIRCFLRYRIQQGKLTFIVKINRRELLEKEAFINVVKEIGDKTQIVPVYGMPA